MNIAPTLPAQREREKRICTQCRYVVENPFVERCPRCNELLPHLELHCTGCFHAAVCPVRPKESERKVVA